MTENRKRVIVDEIEFGTVVQFPRILTSAITALQPPRLIIGLLLVTALISGGRLWDHLVPPHTPPGGLLAAAMTAADRDAGQQVLQDVLAAWDTVPEGTLDAREVHARVHAIYTARLDAGDEMPAEGVMLDTFARIEGVRPRGAFEATAGFAVNRFTRVIRGVLRLRPAEAIDAGIDLLIRLPAALWTHEKAFAIVYGLFATLVLSVGGGALSRMAACHWAGGERLRMSEAWDFALGNWWSLFTAPLLPVLLVVIFGILVAALGLLLRLPWVFQLVGALSYGIALLCGAMIAFLVVGYCFGAPLIPAVACERCDPAEAQQRAFAYVLNRPFHRLGYGITALVGLALGYLAISIIAVVLLNGTAAMFSALAGDRPALAAIGGVELFALTAESDPTLLLGGTDLAAARVMNFFQSAVLWLVGAYVVSYFFTAATLNYLLMRRTCDGQEEIQELWRPGPRVPGDTPGAVDGPRL